MNTYTEQLTKNREILFKFFPKEIIPDKKNVSEVLELLSDHSDPHYSEKARMLNQLCLSWSHALNGVKDRFESPHDVYARFRDQFRTQQQECLIVVLLKSGNRLICDQQVACGESIVSVQPKLVFGPAVRHRASKVICLHYSPNRECAERNELDDSIVSQLAAAGKTLKIQLLDYLLLTDGDYCSLMEDPFTFYTAQTTKERWALQLKEMKKRRPKSR